MNKKYLFTALLVLAISPNTTQAQGFLDRIDNVINKVDQTISSGERAQNTADRVMDKIPEKEEQPAPAQPAAATPTTSTDEEAILQQAREIEERRILEAAERIKEERAATAGNQ